MIFFLGQGLISTVFVQLCISVCLLMMTQIIKQDYNSKEGCFFVLWCWWWWSGLITRLVIHPFSSSHLFFKKSPFLFLSARLSSKLAAVPVKISLSPVRPAPLTYLMYTFWLALFKNQKSTLFLSAFYSIFP